MVAGRQQNKEQQKKLLVLTDWFWPGYKAGGPIQSCVNLCKALNKSFDIYVLTTDTDHASTEAYNGITADKWLYNEVLNVQVCHLKKITLSAAKIRRYAMQCKADTIYLNHLFSPLFVVYPIWLFVTGTLQNKMVVCPRGALYDSALSVKKYKKMPLLLLYRLMGIHKKIIFHATNSREATAIKKYFPGSNILVADNLPDIQQEAFVSIDKKKGELSCVFISRIVPIKNLLYVLQVIKEVQQTIKLTIAGPAEDKSYFEACMNLVKLLPANIEADYIGAVDNNDVKKLIQQHHLFILPTKGENFGHSIIEALIAGRPVLISDQTPWNGVNEKMAGWALPLDQPAEFTHAIEALALTDNNTYNLHAKAAWQFANNYIAGNTAVAMYEKMFT